MGCANVTIYHFGGEGSALASIGYQAFASAGTGTNNVTELVINKGVVLEKDSSTGTTYHTFGKGYKNIQRITISATAHEYGDDTSALVTDLFNEVRTGIQVTQLY